MTQDLVRTQLQKSLGVKSLTDLVRAKTSEDVLLLIDVSGSMKDKMRNGKAKIEGLREVVKEISSGRQVKMIAFGGHDGGAYVTSGVPAAGGGTPLTEAIDLAATQNAGRVIVIPDGSPNNPTTAMEAATRFGGRIDVVYVGNPGDFGEEFLRRLAASTGGTEFHGDLSEVKELGGKIAGLLDGAPEGSDDDEKTAIQL